MDYNNSIKRRLGEFYYPLVVFIIILIAYFPIAFQLLSLKNDIVQLDLPVKYFISKEIHRGQLPLWIYSWAGGFPLGHLFTWSIYSPVTLLFASLFHYDLSTLHLEYIFYLFIGGWGITQICRKHLSLSDAATIIAASLYVLSGITISCSQFMAYLATIAFLPWVYYSFVQLIKQPKLFNCLFFSLTAFLLISWSYPAGSIICFYSLLALAIISQFVYKKQLFQKSFLLYLFLGALIVCLLCLPLIYTTLHTIPGFSRSEELYTNRTNFGYLHPSSVLTLLFPFYNSNSQMPNTTFLFQNINIGMAGFGVMVFGFLNTKTIQQHKKTITWLGIGALVTLIISFGDVFYIKQWLNELMPGFKWFRFPSFFRIFFLFFVSLLVGIFLDANLHSKTGRPVSNLFKSVLLSITAVALALSFYKLFQWREGLLEGGIGYLFSANGKQVLLTLLFFCWTLVLLLFIITKYKTGFQVNQLIVADLIVTALLSLPVYAISNYSIRQMNDILKIDTKAKETVQIDQSGGVYYDHRGNSFNGLNVYSNKIDVRGQYWGPLFLKSYKALTRSEYVHKPPATIIFIKGADSINSRVQMKINTFENHVFSALIEAAEPQKVMLFQIAHPFWKAYIDNLETPVLRSKEGLMYINYTGGDHEVMFVFKDSMLQLLNLVFFITFPLLILTLFLLKWRGRHV